MSAAETSPPEMIEQNTTLHAYLNKSLKEIERLRATIDTLTKENDKLRKSDKKKGDKIISLEIAIEKVLRSIEDNEKHMKK